jgi:hypothetical protein
VQLFKIGSLCIVGISGEPFFETEHHILNNKHKANSWVLGYCNAYSGYLPTRRAFSEGGYEVSDSYRYLGTWHLDPSCEHRVVNAARRLLREHHAD